MNNAIKIGLLTLASIGTVSSAGAQQVDCSSRSGERLLSIGEGAGSRLADALWQILGENCDRIDPFVTGVLNNFEDEPGASCIAQGFNQGAVDTTLEILAECEISCLDEGSQVGELIGQNFCFSPVRFTSILPPPPPPVICSSFQESACNFALDSFVATNCPELALDPNLESVRSGCDFKP